MVRGYFRSLFLSCLFALWGVPEMAGQVAVKFDKISSREAFYPSIVYSIVQDSFGNIWAGTEEGVIRYNSRETYLYNKYSGLLGNKRNRTSEIFIDEHHRIWIGTEEGISLYDTSEDVFKPVRRQEGVGPTLVKSIIEDDQHRIWIGAFNGIWRYLPDEKDPEDQFRQLARELNVLMLHCDGDRLIAGTDRGLYVLDTNSDGPFPSLVSPAAGSLAVTAIHQDDRFFLIGTKEDGIFRADPNLVRLENIELRPLAKRAYPVNKIVADKKGHYYVATDGAGLLYLDREGRLLDQYTNDANQPHSISSDGIYDVILDGDKILWIATYGGGINSLNLSENYFQNIGHNLNDKNSIAHNFTRSILEDKEGNLWFGTKEGISIWYRSSGNWHHIPSLGSNTGDPDIVMALAEDGDYIWAGTYGQGAFRINKKDYSAVQYHEDSPPGRRIGLSRVYSILLDRHGNCWLGGIEEDLHCLSSTGESITFPISQVRDIIESRDGSILVAGRTGVQRISEGRITEVESLKPSREGLNYTTLSCLFEDEEGNLIVGTNGTGLLFYDIENQQTRIFDTSDNLPSDIVQGVLQDESGAFWVSTTRGLANLRVSTADTHVKVFNRDDGLASSEFNYGSYAKLADGMLAFGGVEGVTIFRPEAIGEQIRVPKIVLEDLQLLNKKSKSNSSRLPANINAVEEVLLRHFENDLRLKFAGVLHSTPSKVWYSWKMKGLNESWSEPSEENQINFVNLSPGEYIFEVRAANRDAIWGDVRRLKISIASPWWRSPFAFAIYFLLGGALIAGLIVLSGVLIRKRNADEQLAFFSNITHELKTPLSILLSTLDSSSQDQGAGANEKIKVTVKRLNALFEQLLNFNKAASSQIQARYITKIHLKTHVEQVVNSFKPLLAEHDVFVRVVDEWDKEVFYYDKEALDKILFNLISNAIKYSRERGEIEVALKNSSKGGLKLIITDNGIGIPKDQQKFILKRYYRGRNAINSQLPGTGLGLMIVKNLAERDKGSIIFESVENQGTTFTVLLKDQSHLYHKSAILNGSEQPKVDDFQQNGKIAEFSDAKILIVEDNDELREMLVEDLGTFFQVLEARNGREGLALAQQSYPDLIITDLIMPVMDGMALCQELQNDIHMNHIPIFMMTVLSNSEYKLESIESGVSEFMEKPIDINYLLAKIINTLDWQKKLRERYLHHAEIENAEKYRNKREAEFLNGLEKFVLEKIREENLSVYDLCRHVGMSRTGLYMKLKNMIDLSPQNFIIRTRLKYARKLFLEKNLNVKEVAYMAGFSNPKYFSTSFKKVFKESPTAFLKKLQPD